MTAYVDYWTGKDAKAFFFPYNKSKLIMYTSFPSHAISGTFYSYQSYNFLVIAIGLSSCFAMILSFKGSSK